MYNIKNGDFIPCNRKSNRERKESYGRKKRIMVCVKQCKKEYIEALLPELKLLRAKTNISQDDLASILSISRQTYCQIENGNKDMSWNIYLSLIFFFDSLEEISKLISLLGIYPHQFVEQIRISTQERQMV